MASLKTSNIYLAIRNESDRSHLEDPLLLDGVDVFCFASAQQLWQHFQVQSVRFALMDRRFEGDFDAK